MTGPTSTQAVSPRSVGAELARLRESFGLTQQEVSERLHIRGRYISAMEEGRYELLPGKVYARGYVHTYAEFLGLNPEETVTQCFASEPVAKAVPVVTTPVRPAAHMPSMRAVPWKMYGAAGTGMLVVLLLISQLFGNSREEENAAVSPVPEDMLASVRTLLMPTPRNITCLTGTALGCSFADGVSRKLDMALHGNALGRVGTFELRAVDLEPVVEHNPIAPTPEAAPVAAPPAPKPVPAVTDRLPAEENSLPDTAPLLAPEAGGMTDIPAAELFPEDEFIDVIPVPVIEHE